MPKVYKRLELEEIKLICKIYGYDVVAELVGDKMVTFKARLNENLQFTEQYRARTIKALDQLGASKLLKNLSRKLLRDVENAS